MASESARSTLPEWTTLLRPALGAAAVGVVLCVLGGILFPAHFFRSYLVAYMYWLGIGLGCMAVLLLQHLTRGRWGLVLRNVLEAATRTMPLLALLFLPLLLGLRQLYPWVDPGQWAYDQTHEERQIHRLMEHKEPYLNLPFFLVRAGLYFLIWIVLSVAVNSLSAVDERNPSALARQRLRTLSGPGLAFYGLTISLAAVDWLMSLEPLWYSSIFGVVVAMSQILPGMAFAVAVLIWLSRRPEVAAEVPGETWGDLGNLLLAFVMLWAYVGFSQFFLMWAGNLPEETVWYTHRAWGVWEVLAWSFIAIFFFLPFALLMSREVKRHPERLAWVTGIVLVMTYVYYFWVVMPTPASILEGELTGRGEPFRPEMLWLDAAAFFAVGGLWLAWFLWQLQSRPLLPVRALERLEEAQHA